MKKLVAILRFLLKHSTGRIGLVIIALIVSISAAAPLIAPYDPRRITGKPFSPPSADHILGTNDVGQDLLSELIYGGRVSLVVGIVAGVVAALLGSLAGIASAVIRGSLGDFISSIIDSFMLLPSLPLMLVLGVFMGPGMHTIITAIVITAWAPVARTVRAQALSLMGRPFIEAALAVGSSEIQIMFRHVIPNLTPLVSALTVLLIGDAMIAEAALSFLGLGDPTAKSWGAMLYWAFISGAFSSGAWWWILPPGLMIGLTVFGFASLGYAIEEYVNPRLRT